MGRYRGYYVVKQDFNFLIKTREIEIDGINFLSPDRSNCGQVIFQGMAEEDSAIS